MADGDDCANHAKGQVTNDVASDDTGVSKMKVVELKDALKARKLKTTGCKAELVERLKAALLLEDAKDDDDEEDSKDETDSEDDEEYAGATRRGAKYVPTFKDVEESMSRFSGDDGKSVRCWLKDFDDTAKLCEWSDVQKTIYAKRLLCGSAKLFINYERCGNTWRGLKSALRSEFTKSVNSHTIHKELAQRKKKDDETYHEYMYKMLDIASQVDMDTDAVTQYIIDGIKDVETNKSILYGARSIRQLKEKLTQYEIMMNNAKTRLKSEDRPGKEGSRNDVKIYQKNATRAVQLDRRCYNCGGKNHMSADCPLKGKGPKCFKCQEFGHVATNCPLAASTLVPNCNVVRFERKKACKNVCIGEHKLSALIDSGSDLSLIRADTCIKIGAPVMNDRKIQFRGIGSKDNSTLGEFMAKITIDAQEHDILLRVVSDVLIQQDLIIGYDFLNTVDVRMNRGNFVITAPQEQSINVPEVFQINTIENNDEIDRSCLLNSELVSKVESVIESFQTKKTKEVGVNRLDDVIVPAIYNEDGQRRLKRVLETASDHSEIVTGVPRGNGQVEWVNRTIIPMMAKLAAPQPKARYKHVERAQEYLNHVPSRSTGMSPFSLKIGTRMRLKDDPQIEEIVDKDAAVVFQDARDQLRMRAKDSIAKVQKENRRGYNRRRKKVTKFKMHDLVAIQKTQVEPGLKLYPKLLGPYQVVKVLRNDRYLVEKVGEHEGPRATSTPIDHMKYWPDDQGHNLSENESEGNI